MLALGVSQAIDQLGIKVNLISIDRKRKKGKKTLTDANGDYPRSILYVLPCNDRKIV